MALMKCPECELQVSDKAFSCPHCGYPFSNVIPKPKKRTSSKRKRLPNGFGSITKLNNPNLRKPFLARKTIGKDPLGKPILKSMGYFETYNKAYEALIEYNKNPYDLNTDGILFYEVYDKWTEQYFETLTNQSSIRTITAAYSYCSPLYKMRFKDIRIQHLKGCILDAQVGDNTKNRMKSMFNLMYDWAIEYEIVDTNYARNFSLKTILKGDTPTKEKLPFTKTEIETLWKNVDTIQFVDMILIHIYSGWRPQELATLKHSDIDLEEGFMYGGMKTDAGKNRLVPIHSKIFPLIQKRYEQKNDFLFCDENSRDNTMTYDKYRKRFVKVMERLQMNHTPHEARHTFITLAKEHNVDEYALKKIVGHTIADVTEAVYTHRNKEWLKEEIEKI